VPLFFDEQVIGVLELLDKQGATSFSPEDMEALWMFANLAAVAIEQSLTNHNLAALVGQIVESMQELPDYQRESLREQGKTFAANLEGERQFERAVDLARLVAEIVQHGDAAATACRSVLSAFAEYIRATQANHNDFDISL
jgi:GAF domain-containing protein